MSDKRISKEESLICRCRVLLLLAVVTFSFGGVSASAASLVMLERPGCIWCVRWHEEIGPVLPKTELGRAAALRRVDLAQAWPDDLAGIARDQLTPTFILMDDGREVARLRGYPGEAFFWSHLETMIDKLVDRP
jgi:hypothetical protein